MGDAVVISACRSAIGTAGRGTLVDVDPFDMARTAVREVVGRSGIDPADIDDIVLGEVLHGGGVIARHAAVEAGLIGVPGAALNRHCATGLTAVQTAAASIRAGMDRVVVCGGVESASLMPTNRRRMPGTDDWEEWMSPSHPDRPDAPNVDMSVTVGWNTAQIAGLSREEMDEWAYQSHGRAVAAIDRGDFLEEIFPLRCTGRDGETTVFQVDEHPRRDTSRERLAALKPLHPEIEGFSITAGNASGSNDGVATLLLADREWADARGHAALAAIRAWASVGVDPSETGLAPVLAIPKALARAGLCLADVDLFEINEAFASVAVASSRRLGLPHDIVNVQGSGCSLGHPVAATGARMIVTMVYELRRRGGGIGVVSMCAGGGMGAALVVEVAR